MVQHGSISAWVTVDNHSLEEYGEEWNEAKDKVTCWIPSEAGKEFQLHLKHENATYDTSAHFYIDGNLAKRQLLRSSINVPGKRCPSDTASCASIQTSPTTERALLFASLQLSDDDSLLECSVAPEIGEIRIEHVHITIRKQSQNFAAPLFKEVHAIHEGSKKGTVTHRTGLGVEKIVAASRRWKSVTVAHLLTVIFRYRPLDMLQASDIAPPPAPLQPVASTSNTNKRAAPTADMIDISSDDSEDDAHIAKLKAELALALTRKQKKKKVKREHEVKITPVKTEASLKSEA